MALLGEDPEQLAPIEAALLQAGPEEHRQIVIVLEPYRDEVVPRLWQALEDAAAPSGQRFRAAVALAAFDDTDPRWPNLGAVPVRELVENYHESLSDWIPLLRPVRSALIPSLEKTFHDAREGRVRARAAHALANYASDRPAVLAHLLLYADADQYRHLWPAIPPHGDEIAERMEKEIQRPLPEEYGEKDVRAQQCALAAVTLLRLGRPQNVWPLLVLRPDPQVRSYLIDSLAPYGVDPTLVIARLQVETDSTARHALLLGLGEFSTAALPVQAREQLAVQLFETYRSDTNAGLRAAAEWVLRRWKYSERLAEADRILSRSASRTSSGKTGWYVNGEGFTMVAIAPRKFQMGSPPSEPGRGESETLHERTIPRTYVIASKCVTVNQFARFLKQHPQDQQVNDEASNVLYDPDPECSVTSIDWYLAAKYCRWLSEREGVAQDQMCYPPINEIKAGMKLPARCLERTGYRLPTEAEWECACRAGSITARYYGDTDTLLDRYGWYVRNSDDHAWPGALKKPNDLGLFDMLGNMGQWTHSRYLPYPSKEGTDDEDEVRTVTDDQHWVMRGGNFSRRGAFLRSAMRFSKLPTYTYVNIGLRVARTCR
jgi:formylglycine-generating enzyme required for sulfatase activity